MKRAAITVLAVMLLAGCASPAQGPSEAALTNEAPAVTVDEAVAAYQACQELVSPEFDDPDSVVWPDTAEPNEGTDYDFVVDVTSSAGASTVTCSVDNASGDWMLASFNIFAG